MSVEILLAFRCQHFMSSYPFLHSLRPAHVPRGPVRFPTIEVLSNNIGVVRPGEEIVLPGVKEQLMDSLFSIGIRG